MTKFKILIGFCSFLLLFPIITMAIGQTTEPIVMENALRGEEFEQQMIIINTEGDTMNIDLSARGDIENWVTFYKPNDLENPIDSIILEATDQTANVIAVFSVPEDTSNGEYTGFVGVAKGSENESNQEGSSTSVSQKIDRVVAITVTDQEIINLAVSVIPEKYDLTKDEPLKVRLIYDNQSNVSLSPQVEFKIKQGENIFYNAIFPYPNNEPKVRPSSQYEIPAIEIATSGLEKGKYTVELNFLHNNESILIKDFTVSIGQVNNGFVLGAIDFNLDIRWLLTIGALIIFAIAVGLMIWRGKKTGNLF